MNGEQVAGIVRTLLAAASGFVVAKGWFDAATYNAVAGAIGTLIVAGWSFASKKPAA